MTITTSPDRETMPAVPCAPWCGDGLGHTDADALEDQVCLSEPVAVALTRYPLMKMSDGTTQPKWVSVQLERASDAVAHVVLEVPGISSGVALSLDEATLFGEAMMAAAIRA
jgi:hypothetical protein